MERTAGYRIIRITTMIIALMTILMGAVSLYGDLQPKETLYIASDRPEAPAYVLEDGKVREAEPIPRGSEVIRLRDPIGAPGDGGLFEVRAGAEQVFVSGENLTDSRDSVVREQKMYVRTPVTVCEEAKGCRIAGFVPKKGVLEVTGYDFVAKDGKVNKYRVRSGDTEGYVCAGYLAFTPEEAAKNCNEKGAYDMAKDAKYYMQLHGGKAVNLDYFPHEKPKIEGNELCRDARAMYLTAGALMKDEYFELAKESGVNAVVINMDGGTPAYKSPVVKEYCPTGYRRAHHSLEKYRERVKKYQDAGFYTIGRIVCFNDEAYAKDHPKACIRTGGKRTKWVSAYDRKAWEYKVSFAVEGVETMGFNEIQFDYVRFPERSYEMSVSGDTDFRNRYHEEKAQAIQNFCLYAADRIHEAGGYFSVDVFGECSNGYVSAYGQYWPALSNVVDVISSMPYTDHQGEVDTWTDPYATVYSWAKKSAKMQKHIPTPAVARTWITGYNTPYWAPSVDYDYGKLRAQVKALEDAGLDGGFIPWHSSSSYEKYKEYREIWKSAK